MSTCGVVSEGVGARMLFKTSNRTMTSVSIWFMAVEYREAMENIQEANSKAEVVDEERKQDLQSRVSGRWRCVLF